MKLLWQLFYSYVVIPAIWISYHILGFMNEKIRNGISGRRNITLFLQNMMRTIPEGKRVWIHASSMGEFEQAKPIITALKERHPEVKIIVTFFSPSGYEHSKTYPLADVVSYLPFDSLTGAKMFVRTVMPDLGILVRYDIWPNHIWELRRRDIPVLIANATINRRTVRRLPAVKSFHRYVYNDLSEILTVSNSDAETFRLLSVDRPQIMTVGDTRFDQVTIRSREAVKRKVLPEHVRKERTIIVAGSCWPNDDNVVLPSFEKLLSGIPGALLVHVPHEPNERHLREVEEKVQGKIRSCRFSRLANYREESMIIVDNVGNLLSLYASADVAFIGGSFGEGVHNVLEAAVFGIPVLFGPRHYNSQEPLQLLDWGGGFVVENRDELVRTLRHLVQNESAREHAGKCAADFVAHCTGATGRVLSRVEHHLSFREQSRKRLSSGVLQ